jgi:hypothetical protein
MAVYYDSKKIRNPELRKLFEEIMDVTVGHDHDGENSRSVTIAGGTVADGAIGTSKIADAAVTLAKLAATMFTANEAGRAKFANSFVNAALIATDAVETAKIKNDAVTLDKLADLARGSIIVGGASDAPTALNAKASAQILIGDGTDLKSVAVSGDVTIASTGAVTIGAKKVTTAMLADNASANCKAIADPGTGQAIPVTGSGYVEIAVGDTAETNSLAVPTFVGQELTIYAVSRAGSGTRTITVASAFNTAGNNTILLDAAGETIVLRAIKIGTALAWRVIVADGATLSTVG